MPILGLYRITAGNNLWCVHDCMFNPSVRLQINLFYLFYILILSYLILSDLILSVSNSPSSSNVDPRYLNIFTLSNVPHVNVSLGRDLPVQVVVRAVDSCRCPKPLIYSDSCSLPSYFSPECYIFVSMCTAPSSFDLSLYLATLPTCLWCLLICLWCCCAVR